MVKRGFYNLQMLFSGTFWEQAEARIAILYHLLGNWRPPLTGPFFEISRIFQVFNASEDSYWYRKDFGIEFEIPTNDCYVIVLKLQGYALNFF